MGEEAKPFGITSPLITKSDGSKFGKSEGKNIWLDPERTSAYEFYQFWLNTPDADVIDYLKRLSFRSPEEIMTLEESLKEHPELHLNFSISCTSRAPRGTEQNGVEYFFLTPEEFRQKIANDEFLEYEEVYEDRFYGTLKEQVVRQREAGQNVVFDVDVKGGCNIKEHYGDEALSLFIQPPSIEELRRRLVNRGTDSPEAIEDRLAKAAYELTFAERFDCVVVNDDLATAEADAYRIVSEFLSEEKNG